MRALMLMPFDPEFDDVYQHIESAVRKICAKASKDHTHPRWSNLQDLELYRVDEGHGAVPIMDDLLNHMRDSSLCIADISGNNPNVLWELGYAMALEKPIIILSQNVEEAPFDLSIHRLLEYDRDRLGETLIEPLSEQILGVFEDVPEVVAFPDKYGFARTLAMSTAAPAYFLNSKFEIIYMNEAAIALFLTDKPESPGKWVGRSLIEFINEISDRLVNLPDIEKNLQLQKENLQNGLNVPLNVETVVLKTKNYGTIEMQKTGIAVRNQYNGNIDGWVVSFNAVNPTEPERYCAFHEKHKSILEGRVLCVSQPAVESSQTLVPPPSNLDWDEVADLETEKVWAEGYSEKQECFEFMADVMRQDERRFGLKSVDYLSPFFFDYKSTEFLAIRSEQHIVGVLRMHMNHNVSTYPNLASELALAIQDGQSFADTGIYLRPETPTNERIMLLAQLLGFGVEKTESVQVPNLYGQVPYQLLPRYEDFGFKQAGKPFECEGWKGKWIPIWVNNWQFESSESNSAKIFHEAFDSSKKSADFVF